ncbi:BlaI/MecI/CopY family transcriptional regulator [Sulfidibacter corallicola]|nr:BlaI/MecI/CopY family transcriptional regulator [Sulfidibacter corallicola]
MLRLPHLALGELERLVLDLLWSEGPLNPVSVHQRIGAARGISPNTVSSALKRLYEKGLLKREKVSHAFVYRAAMTRAEFQRDMIGSVASQFGDLGGSGVLAAFVDLAESRGEDTLRRLEQMIAERLAGADE